MSAQHKLTKSDDRWVAGVCGGIADFIGWKPAVVRMLWVFGSVLFAGIGGLIAYTVLACIMPPSDGRRKFRLDDFRVQ